MKIIVISILGLVLLATMVMGVFAVPPTPPNPPARPMQLCQATIDGGEPDSVDPAWAYDTASSEMIVNVYDTLVTMDGEHMDTYLPVVAESWTLQNITGTTSPEGVAWYYRYVFKLRNWANMTFQPPYGYSVTAADVEYSFERAMVQDRAGGPAWMFYEPLFNSWGAAGLGTGDLEDEANVHNVGLMIDHAVEENGTHVWFNIGFPGAYAPFMQILCQSWSSIMSKQWINNHVIGDLGRPDWDGDWTKVRSGWTLDHTDWVAYHDPTVSPLEEPTSIMYGSGPFMLQTFSIEDSFWEMDRHVAYWRGWPAPFPSMANAKPAGYVDEFKCTWAYSWANRRAMFLAGEVDFCDVPGQYISELYQSSVPPFRSPPNYPLDGIRCIGPLPQLKVDCAFFTFEIDPTTVYGPINAPGVFDEEGIPSDFFGNPTWGIHVRKGFAWAFDYATYISAAFLGEAIHPATAIIPGLLYYDPTVTGYTQNLVNAAAEFAQVPGLKFGIKAVYNTGSLAGLTACNIFKAVLEAMNPEYHVNFVGITWSQYLTAGLQQKLPFFITGWLAAYPDPHSFAFPFYQTYGNYPVWQKYSNPAMDALVQQGIETPDGPARAAIYKQIQELAIADCPSFTLEQAVGRHFERDWVVGWYYNPIYTGIFAYNIWKWYYTPHVRFTPPTAPISQYLPADINYDGHVDIKDISMVARWYSVGGPPMSERWLFRADFNPDRKIDARDIAYMIKYFGPLGTTAIWVPS
jgi:peptide/nickel transport system substrate-binding protein